MDTTILIDPTPTFDLSPDLYASGEQRSHSGSAVPGKTDTLPDDSDPTS